MEKSKVGSANLENDRDLENEGVKKDEVRDQANAGSGTDPRSEEGELSGKESSPKGSKAEEPEVGKGENATGNEGLADQVEQPESEKKEVSSQNIDESDPKTEDTPQESEAASVTKDQTETEEEAKAEKQEITNEQATPEIEEEISTQNTDDPELKKEEVAQASEVAPESKDHPEAEEKAIPKDEKPETIEEQATSEIEEEISTQIADEPELKKEEVAQVSEVAPESKDHSEAEEKAIPKDEKPETTEEQATTEIVGEDATGKDPLAISREEDEKLEGNKDKDHEEKPEASGERLLNSEDDLKEKDEADDSDRDDDDERDYSVLTKEQLVEEVQHLAREGDPLKSEKLLNEMTPFFEEIVNKERVEALKKFKEEGGEEADFVYKGNQLDKRFSANVKLLHDRRKAFIKEREAQKDKNLDRKKEVLEELRAFVDSEETNISFNKFKEIQEEWKKIGPVPRAQAGTLWANYNALIHRFYDNRSIYYELKELDRKKNLESKQELCERAENLINYDQLKDAISELNDLHHEYKHIGPVPREEQEALWQRFKAASDAVYAKRREFVEGLKKDLEKNFEEKMKLTEKVKEFVEFDSDRIKQWNKKTKEIIELQKQWESIGGLPRAKARDVNKKFWGSFKQFFSNKGDFFKKLDADKEDNLVKKKEMVERAKALMDNENWKETAEKLKDLQREWKEIGPVPGKYREKIYKEFKKACDHFFNRKRENVGDLEKEYVENLSRKEDIIREIEELTGKKEATVDNLRMLEDAYNDIGFVPKKAIHAIRKKYKKAVDKYLDSVPGLTEEEKETLIFEEQVERLKSQPNSDHKIYKKEQGLRKQITELEDNIALWRNNLAFFNNSQKAEELKAEFDGKIDDAREEVAQLKHQLRILRQIK